MEITVKTSTQYKVHIKKGILDNVGEITRGVAKAGARVMIVSETNVFPLYGQRIIDSLTESGFRASKFIFKAGESSKTMKTVCEIYEELSRDGFTRSDIIMTLGGGVAGDMGGFAAATFLRGISFIQVPTSLLAQVDASVGGKTGVDLPFGKNLVGAFHQPSAVIIDPNVLSTLPSRCFNDGMGEVIKYGCVADSELYEILDAEINLAALDDIIVRCVSCKKRIVEKDTNDTGERMILNFGHTFGHALEKLNNFNILTHGEAVGIGMIIASEIGEKIGKTPKGMSKKIESILKKYGLPTSHKFTSDQLIEATALDKKSDGDILNLILLSDIGKAIIFKTDRDRVREVM